MYTLHKYYVFSRIIIFNNNNNLQYFLMQNRVFLTKKFSFINI